MPLKKISYNKKVYKQDTLTDSYICHSDDACWLLVFDVEEENWKGYTNIKMVSDGFKKYRKENDSDYYFEEFKINYPYYVSRLQFLEYEGSSDDAGNNYIAFNLKKYLDIYEPDFLEKIMQRCKLEGINDASIVWRNYGVRASSI